MSKYRIKIEYPLVRKGISIETEATDVGVVKETNLLLKLASEINDGIGATYKQGFTISTEDPNAPKCVGDPIGINDTHLDDSAYKKIQP